MESTSILEILSMRSVLLMFGFDMDKTQISLNSRKTLLVISCVYPIKYDRIGSLCYVRTNVLLTISAELFAWTDDHIIIHVWNLLQFHALF